MPKNQSANSASGAKQHPSPILPGDKTAAAILHRMIRVNHAGEFGAQQIYAGQLAVLKKSTVAPLLHHMAAQEQAHLDYFTAQIIKRRVRPTALYPLWHMAGFALGVGTALLGEKAAMACTVAVEEVIDEHYGQQLAQLDPVYEPELTATIGQFRAEEAEHKDTAIAHEGAATGAGLALLRAAVKRASRTAIWLSERV